MGLSLAWGVLDVLSLAHGALFVFGGFVAHEFSARWNVPFPLLVLLGVVGSGLLAVVIEEVAFRQIRARFAAQRQRELSMLAASIGAGAIIEHFISKETAANVFAVAPSFSIHFYRAGSVQVSNIQLLIVGSLVVLAGCLDWWILRSRSGTAVRAIAFSPKISPLLGIDVGALAMMTMFVSGGFAGLAGVLLGVSTSGLEASTGHSYLVIGFAVVILGGVGSVRGVLVAAYLVAVAQTAIVAYGPGGFRDAVAFVLILLVLLLRPQGLFARKRVIRA
jgi:branched-chain amino acid transport system permease protein